MKLTWARFQQVNDAYRGMLRQPAGQIVLADLADFCKAYGASMTPGDPYMTAFNEGKRAVWNRIQARLRLTDDEVFAIMGGTTLAPQGDDNG